MQPQQTSTFQKKLVLTSLSFLASASITRGDQGMITSFSSEDIANGTVPKSIMSHTPVFIKLDDGNLLCASQGGDGIGFYKTCTGAAVGGAQVNLKIIDGGVQTNSASLYVEISRLEALAYLENDWHSLYELSKKQLEKDPQSVSPAELRKSLDFEGNSESYRSYGNEYKASVGADGKIKFVLVHIEDTKTAPDNFNYDLLHRNKQAVSLKSSRASVAKIGEIMNGAGTLLPTFQSQGLADSAIDSGLSFINVQTSVLSESVYFKFDKGTLMRATEVDGKLRFFKTVEGYALKGAHLTMYGFGGGAEVATANAYTELSVGEARALLGKDAAKFLDRIAKQKKIINESVDPDTAHKLLY